MITRLRRLAALAGVLVVALGSLVMLSATSAFACSCVRMDVAEQARAAAEVFVGTVTDTSRAEGGALVGRGTLDWTVDVDRVWKGDPPARVTVSSSGQTTACGIAELPQSRPVLFFVSDEGAPGSARSVNSCGGTGLLTPARDRAVTAALGPAHAPAADVASASPSSGAADQRDDGAPPEELSSLRPAWQEIALVVGMVVALLVGLAAAAVWVGRQRRRRP